MTFASDHGLALHRILPSPIPSRTRVTFTVFTPIPSRTRVTFSGNFRPLHFFRPQMRGAKMNFSPEASSRQGPAGDASAAPIAACPCTPKGRGRLPGHSRKPYFIGSRAAERFERSNTEQKRQLIAFVFSNLRLNWLPSWRRRGVSQARHRSSQGTPCVSRAAKRPKGDNLGEQA
jgi:hypothetical protein